MQTSVVNTKTCTKCGCIFPATTEYFYAAKTGKFGIAAKCKGCQKEYTKSISDIATKRAIQWKIDNPEKHRENTKRYYEQHKEECNSRTRNYYFKNKEWIDAWISLWKTNNKEKVTWYTRKRRIILMGLEYHHTLDEENNLFEEQNGKCYYCSTDLTAPLKKHLEHKIPLVKGGNDTKENLCWACPSCNYKKHVKTEEEYYEFLLKESLL